MNRREFAKGVVLLGVGAGTGLAIGAEKTESTAGSFYEEPSKKIPVRTFDVVIVGGGTAGVVAALAAARQGAKTVLIESKGYTGGVAVEGGTALHSFYNLWKAFPGVAKRQVVKGIPAEIVNRLVKVGGCTGYPEMERGFNYDSVCTAIDTELHKLVTLEMLEEAGVTLYLNTLVTGAIVDGPRVRGVIANSHSGREAIYAQCFVDCTGYGDLSAYAGAQYTEPNDHAVCNSVGLGNVSIDKYFAFLQGHNAVGQLSKGVRSGQPDQVIRCGSESANLPGGMSDVAKAHGISLITTTVHDNYLMFIKCNLKLAKSPTDRDTVAKAEVEIRRRMAKAAELFRLYVPGCEKAFMARTSPSLAIRRGRLITCDYDITHEDVIGARHFDDDVAAYGFHDSAPRLQIANGGTYGIPYKALRVAGIENLLAAGMLITSNHDAHMSTRNTVSCMIQGQATGTAAALCAARKCGTRELPYRVLRDALLAGGVFLES